MKPSEWRPLESFLVTRQQLTKIFGQHPRTIGKWIEEELPVEIRGRGGRPSLFDLPKCAKWILDRVRRELTATSDQPGGLSPQNERALLRTSAMTWREPVSMGKPHDK